MVPREDVIGSFCIRPMADAEVERSVLPLLPDETRTARLEIERDGAWTEIAKSEINELGWSANFRVEDWDQSKDAKYRVRHGEKASYAGRVRRDPVDKDIITVASLSCNSKKDRGDRNQYVKNIGFSGSRSALLRRRPELRPHGTYGGVAAVWQAVWRADAGQADDYHPR